MGPNGGSVAMDSEHILRSYKIENVLALIGGSDPDYGGSGQIIIIRNSL
jgi:hypothetical protein